MKKKPLVLLILSAFVIIFILFSCSSIKIRTYEMETPLLKEDTSIKIVLISDLHSTIFGKEQIKLIEKIKEQNPDLILLAGDILDDVVPHRGTELLLAGINTIAPIYYVTGNHEYWCREINEIRLLLQSYQVNILSDSYVRINIKNNYIILAGIEDPDKERYETPGYNQNEIMERAFRELDEIDLFKILIAHRPENIETYKKYSFNLVLSGHSHGGQVRIPFIMNGLYAPNQGLFPKYAGGLYRHDEKVHIVSRGLSINPRLPRIFNNPELVVVIIESNILSVDINPDN
ncbi:MAG: metallophosphoesterase [Treponema sp.]|nr:metallophosphoesterase [Treponema sp.]